MSPVHSSAGVPPRQREVRQGEAILARYPPACCGPVMVACRAGPSDRAEDRSPDTLAKIVKRPACRGIEAAAHAPGSLRRPVKRLHPVYALHGPGAHRADDLGRARFRCEETYAYGRGCKRTVFSPIDRSAELPCLALCLLPQKSFWRPTTAPPMLPRRHEARQAPQTYGCEGCQLAQQVSPLQQAVLFLCTMPRDLP